MTQPSAIYVVIANTVRGPFGPEQLRQLADGGAIAPDTAAAADPAGPWGLLRELPAGAGLFREPTRFEFKARSFETVNQAGAPVDHQALIAAANQPAPPPPAGPSAAPAPAENEVLEMLRQNRAREQQAGLDVLAPMPPRPNRRRVDFLVLFIGGNLVFLTGYLAASSVVTALFALSGAAFYTAALTWVMYGVMSRY